MRKEDERMEKLSRDELLVCTGGSVIGVVANLLISCINVFRIVSRKVRF